MFNESLNLDKHLTKLSPIETLRSLISRIDDGDDLVTALRLVAAPAVFTAALIQSRKGAQPVAPNAGVDHATDILLMAGLDSSELHTRALNTYLVTVADHGLNASTFASRVVASTRAGLVSSVLAAISALKGPLHGGAPGPVLDMLDAISQTQHAESWLEDSVVRGERLMGFGHRIYKVRDPRADALKKALDNLQDSKKIDSNRLELALNVERIAIEVLKRYKPGRDLHTPRNSSRPWHSG